LKAEREDVPAHLLPLHVFLPPPDAGEQNGKYTQEHNSEAAEHDDAELMADICHIYFEETNRLIRPATRSSLI
jgi:hypothetical protein